MNSRIYTLLCIILLSYQVTAMDSIDSVFIKNPDSSKTIKSRQLYLSTNFQQIINFHNENNLNLDITARYNLSRTKTAYLYKTRQEINLELSFTKYIDSILEVRDDEIEIKSNWEFSNLKIVNAINIDVKSQLTNSYEYTFTKNEFIKVLSKQTFFPAILSIGTGFNFKFKKDNLINFSPVDIKTTILTDKLLLFYPLHNRISVNLYYQTELGTSITITIFKKWAKDLFSWRNNSRIFIKSLTKDGTTISSKNRIIYDLFKWINLSFENQLLYDPLYNYKLQLRNEMVLGVLFRK